MNRIPLVVIAVAAGAACGTIEGLDHFSPGGADAAAEVADGAPISSMDEQAENPSDGAGEVATTDDAGVDAPADAPAANAESGPSPGPDSGTSDCICVAPAPSGWQGYMQLVLSDAGAPACAAPYGVMQSNLVTAPSSSQAQCSACECAPPSSGPITCQVELGSGGLLCGGEAMTPAPQGVCVIPPGPMGATSGPNGDSYGPTMVPTPIGNCTPDGGAATRPPPQTTSATVCSPADAGAASSCASSGEVCVPSPASVVSAASTKVCIYRSGVQACPTTGYTVAHVASTGVTDVRGCSACACAAPACPSDGYVEGYTSPNCMGAVAATFNASTACTLGDNANNSVSFKYEPSHSAWSGTCEPSGGTPTGSVTLDTASATTFCCLP